VIHLAARVGGVKGNTDYVADFFHDNIMINTNLLNACHKHNIDKVVSVLSTCVYPDSVTYPLTEDQIHMGPPHQSNFGYAYAKRML
ncbi:MAG TPA: GDP-L-fucose synthase, partial [Flavobacteriaceae bacterium]|nr:GDP-L-fucose synthase [Flavobacteriaceae bacterium]